MKNKHLLLIGLVALLLIAVTSVAVASSGSAKPAMSFAETVRQATAQFKDVHKAEAAGYALVHGCVSGPQEGAMGIHFANGGLVGDNALDAPHRWNAKHTTPPVLMGQLFNYVGAPNRYGLPAFYELHVWAWKSNPAGMFADWNPRVSCEEFVGDAAMHGSDH